MSYKTSYNAYSKSFTEKKITALKNIAKKNTSLKEKSYLYPINYSPFNINLLINTNLKKYTTTIKKYHIFIINSIIFDQRIHKVAVFKNNLLWDESSEFLKRFYKIKESIERIPKISEYYENYTLFPPVYFGLEGLIIIIMNKWTKRKKKYLEYLEDHEEEKKEKNKRKKDISFEPLINPSLFNNITSSNLNISKNTLDFTKLENESNNKNACFKCKINDYNKEKSINNKDKKKEDISSLSFSEIINDLSSHYSIKINSDYKENNKDNHKKDKENKNKDNDKKYKKNINNNINKKISKKESINEINVNKTRNTFSNKINNNNKLSNINKLSQKKNINSPRKKIKISLNKKNNKFILSNNNTNLIKRNNNNLPLPFEKYQKKFMNTENHLYKNKDLPNNGGPTSTEINNKGTIRVNTISNYLSEKNKIINNNILPKEESNSIKKTSSNFIKNIKKKNFAYSNSKKNNFTTTNNKSIPNSIEKNLININYNMKNVKKKNYIQIKRKTLVENNNINNSNNNQKSLTYRNSSNSHQFYYLNEKPSISNLIARTSMNKDNTDSINLKDINNIEKNNKKLYLEDPFIYKLTQLTKKRQISLTSTNSLSKIKDSKNFNHYVINSIIETSNKLGNITNKISNNKFNKVNCRKNLVLTRINSKKNMMSNNTKSNFLGEGIYRNNSSSLHKKSNNSLNFNFPGKISNSPNSFRSNNSNNINLNLNLKIHFNIDVDKKNKGKKILLNNAIINQLQNKINNNQKYSNINRNKDTIHQYSLTSKNSQRYLKNLSGQNNYEYTILKKF